MENQNNSLPNTYEAAYEELLQIAKAIESDEISIDQLSTQVARAALLVNFCQEKLRQAEKDVARVIEQMKPNQSA
ncbi:MAG: exodeoxyribonuclease small subunit [Bacteroidota bacterium]|mgnify:CR=1 FL=1|jgi:exodeoxyribonuclease VII small subunit